MRIGEAELRERVREAYGMLAPCEVCPRRCRANRRTAATGKCGAGWLPEWASANIHRGEEPPVSGKRGSGTVFLSRCVLRCAFCQNYPISQMGHGTRTSVAGLADAILRLERRGAHNINFVTPTQHTPQILAGLMVARRRGFGAPVVWNSNGYERVETLRLLDGVVDVYLPDLKYAQDAAAERWSAAPHYWETATAAIREMARQVGPLVVDDDGIAIRGLIVRHLVLPGGLAGTERVLGWIARELPRGTAVSLMGQYFPAGREPLEPPLDRTLTPEEYSEACAILERHPEIGGWTQDPALPGGC